MQLGKIKLFQYMYLLCIIHLFILHNLHKPQEQFGPFQVLIKALKFLNVMQPFKSVGSAFQRAAPECLKDSSPYDVL